MMSSESFETQFMIRDRLLKTGYRNHGVGIYRFLLRCSEAINTAAIRLAVYQVLSSAITEKGTRNRSENSIEELCDLYVELSRSAGLEPPGDGAITKTFLAGSGWTGNVVFDRHLWMIAALCLFGSLLGMYWPRMYHAIHFFFFSGSA
jgi:hypothetical protein